MTISPNNPYNYPDKPADKSTRFTFNCFNCKNRWTGDFVLTCVGWTFDARYDYNKPRWGFVGKQPQYILCPKCGSNRTGGQRIVGRKNNTPCDKRCTSAHGHDCECSCGGQNHGIDHLVSQ